MLFKKLLCIGLLAITTCPSFGSSVGNTPGTGSEDDWSFEGSLSQPPSPESPFKGMFKAQCHVPNDIEFITCFKNRDGSLVLMCDFLEELLRDNPQFKTTMFSIEKNTFLGLATAQGDNPLDLLKSLYDFDFIPDFVVDRFLSKMELNHQDFRVNNENFILEVAKKSLPEDHSFQELLNFVEEEINRISSPEIQQTIRWHTVQALRKSATGYESDLRDFCSGITDPTLPFYDDSRVILADLHLMIGGENSYKKAITSLLQVNTPTKVSSALLNFYVSLFLNDDVMTKDPLPAELQDLNPGPQGAETVMGLLTYIKESRIRHFQTSLLCS